MAFVMQVGGPESFAPMPPNFPQCGDWKGINSYAALPKESTVNVSRQTNLQLKKIQIDF
jgi:hypothetical protein